MIYKSNNADTEKAENFQKVSLASDIKREFPDLTEEKVFEKRLSQGSYACKDNWENALWNDDAIYISVTNAQHQAIVDYNTGKTERLEELNLGFFTDEATLEAAKTDGKVDNARYNEMCQVFPYYDAKNGEISYKPHIDRFVIDRDKMEEVYGRREFPVAVSECLANDVSSAGGGNQGYSHRIQEMLELGILLPDEAGSYSRRDREQLLDGKSVTNNKNELINSTITLNMYEKMKDRADARAKDCIENDRIHPAQEVVDKYKATGTPVHLDSEPGHHTKMRFVEKVKELVSYIRKAPEFTKADEKMLGFMLYKEMNGHCSRDGDGKGITDTYSYRFLNNESVIEPLKELEAKRSDGSFKTKTFIEELAEGYAPGQNCEKGLKQYQEDLKYSHFEYNRTLKEGYENIYNKTGKAYTLSEFAQMSKATVPELTDADVKSVCEECRSQEVQMRNEAAFER